MHHNHIKKKCILIIIIYTSLLHIDSITLSISGEWLVCLKVIFFFVFVYDNWLTNGKAQSFSGPDGKGKPFLRIGGFVISDGD